MLHKRVLDAEDLPPGYPAELESTGVLTDGRTVYIRPLVPADRDGLVWEVANADSETLHLRFFTRAIRSRPDFVDALVDLDYRKRLALAAFDVNGEGAGVARYGVAAEPGTAQVAVVVDPDWRRVGLASLLLEKLQEAAADRGITTLTAVYLVENRAVDRFRASRGIGEPRVRAGLAEVSWPIAAGDAIGPPP